LKKIKRRQFLKISAGAALGMGAASVLNGCGSSSSRGEATVAAVRGDDLVTMTRDALDDLGGISQIVFPGESVFIKPNMVTLPFTRPDHNSIALGECTKPEVVVATAEACLEAGASKVVIGDGSQMKTFDWANARFLDDSTDLVQEVVRLNAAHPDKVSLACLEVDSPGWVEVPSQTPMGVIAISSVCEFDRVISIPVAKTHSWAQLTLSLKNFIGVTSISRYGVWMNNYWDRGLGLDHSSPVAISQIFLDIVAAIQPDLAIIDFSHGVEGNGPSVGESQGQTVDVGDRLGSKLILASTDLVAADATAARIMSHTVEDIHQLTMAQQMGLGVTDESAIQIQGARLSELQMDWTPAILKNPMRRSGSTRSHLVAPGCPLSKGGYLG
jgi:uncharacterized protein (DUF362 family)